MRRGRPLLLALLTLIPFAPDGRVFVCEQTGALRVVKDDKLLPEPFVTLKVDSYWERGLIGVTLAPDFTRNGYVYVCYVSPSSYPRHVVSCFAVKGDVAAPESEANLLEGDDLGIPGGKLVAPGNLAASVLYQRMGRRGDAFATPPLASGVCDREALEATAEWIKGLAAAPHP